MDRRGLPEGKGTLIRAGTCALLLAAGLAAATPAAAALLEFLHVEANAGTASGGHFALRLGDEVFHYQNRGGDSLRMVREDFDFFRYVYGVLQNRGIRGSRVAVDDDTWARIHERFASRLLVEELRFDALEAQQADVALIEFLLGAPAEGAAADPPLRVPGAAWFEIAGHEEPALRRLRERVAHERGARFLRERLAALRTEQRALALPPLPRADSEPSRDRIPPPQYAFSQHVSDLAAKQLALEAVLDGASFERRWLRSEAAGELSLRPSERAALADYARRLEARLVALTASRRPDWGGPLLLGMARLVALDESLRQGRLVVLDAFPAAASVLPHEQAAGRAAFLHELRDDAAARLAETRARVLAEGAPDERGYSDLEDAANRFLELREGGGHDVRVFAERLVPEGRAPVPRRLLPRLDRDALLAALPVAHERARAARRSLARLYRYDLVHRNCVTEVFETIHAALPPGEIEQRLGGRVEPGDPLGFVPFVAAAAVEREYRVVAVTDIPSFRRQRLAEMYAHGNPLRVYLRETNTLSSSLYRDNPRDGFFLLFTDDVVWPRPLYGALNLLGGLAQTLAGVLALPVDGGQRLVSGAEGAFFSLPELVFVNLRKGTFEYGRSRVRRTRALVRERPAS